VKSRLLWCFRKTSKSSNDEAEIVHDPPMTPEEAMSESATITIKQAAKLSGLSSSVLRVWEFRYGWPCPRRSVNGYRAFTKAQIEELRRAAALVKGGMPVSHLIVDGYPKWPAVATHKPRIRRFDRIRALPLPAAVAPVRDRLAAALETGNGGRVLEIIQSAPLEVRPADEAAAVLVPALVGLAELEQDHRPLREAAAVRALVMARARQLARRLPEVAGADIVTAAEEAVAVVAALIMTQQGRPAVPGANGHRISALGGGSTTGLVEMLGARQAA
jgi:hypothetical protein